jgi:hypothetical protein
VGPITALEASFLQLRDDGPRFLGGYDGVYLACGRDRGLSAGEGDLDRGADDDIVVDGREHVGGLGG